MHTDTSLVLLALELRRNHKIKKLLLSVYIIIVLCYMHFMILLLNLLALPLISMDYKINLFNHIQHLAFIIVKDAWLGVHTNIFFLSLS